MEFGGINYIAVVVAAVAAFAFSVVFYMTLAKPWMAAVGKTEADMEAERRNPRPYITAIVSQLIMAWVLAGVVGHLGTGQVTVANGLISGAFVWFGFIVTSMVVNHGFQGAKASLTLIDSGHWLGVLLVQGLVIGLFGV